MKHKAKFKPNSQRKNLKYVPTPLPKRPSISFIEPYHNSILFKVLMILCFVLFIFIVTLYLILLCRLIDLAFELSVTVLVNFDFIWRLMVSDCGRAFSVSLRITFNLNFWTKHLINVKQTFSVVQNMQCLPWDAHVFRFRE